MIILRRLTKLFARRDVFPDSLRKIYELNEKLIKECNGKIIIKIERSDTFKTQYNQSTNSNRSKIDKFIEELQDDSTWFENGNNSFADTHYLEDYSNKSKGFVMFSKKINDADRLNYKIYKPEIRIDEKTGKKLYYQKIVLDSCSGHIISGKSGNYYPGEQNTWHSPNKSAKLKRKLKKQNKKDDLK